LKYLVNKDVTINKFVGLLPKISKTPPRFIDCKPIKFKPKRKPYYSLDNKVYSFEFKDNFLTRYEIKFNYFQKITYGFKLNTDVKSYEENPVCRRSDTNCEKYEPYLTNMPNIEKLYQTVDNIIKYFAFRVYDFHLFECVTYTELCKKYTNLSHYYHNITNIFSNIMKKYEPEIRINLYYHCNNTFKNVVIPLNCFRTTPTIIKNINNFPESYVLINDKPTHIVTEKEILISLKGSYNKNGGIIIKKSMPIKIPHKCEYCVITGFNGFNKYRAYVDHNKDKIIPPIDFNNIDHHNLYKFITKHFDIDVLYFEQIVIN